MNKQSECPPSNAKRIYRWADLPEAKHAASFLIENEGAESFEITLSKHQRQVFEGLMLNPIYAASYCRISDQVKLLREMGVDIRTQMYRNDPETGRERYGVYFLHSKITPPPPLREAA